jgi:hypothetical protein
VTLTRGLLIVATTTAAAAVLGSGLGYALGVFTPDYYRMVFHVPPGMPLDPVQVGVGLGLTQGLFAGLAAGSVVVASVAWCASRREQAQGRGD